MNCSSPVFRALLILALMLNGIMAAPAAARHELAGATPAVKHTMACHEHGMPAYEDSGQRSGKSMGCPGGACFCACAAPSVPSAFGFFVAPSPVMQDTLSPPSHYLSQTTATLLRPPIA